MTTHNPYTPPLAPVADSIESAAPVLKPWQVKYAVYLFWASFVFGILSFVLAPDKTGVYAGDALPIQVIVGVFVLATLAFACLLIICIGWGHRWARIIYSALVVWGCIDAYQVLGESFARSWMDGVVYLLASVTDVAGVVLLLTPPANAWFREVAARRRAT